MSKPMTEAQENFLRKLARWQGVATSQDLGPQVTQSDNSARQTCKRRGWVTYDGSYWRLTYEGRQALTNAGTDALVRAAAARLNR